MSRAVVLATVQPPWPAPDRDPDAVVDAAIDLTRKAIDRGAEVICLPEYLNTASLPPWEAGDWQRRAERIVAALRELATRAQVWLAVSLLMDGSPRTNSALLIGPDGVAGRYDKVHLTGTEREKWRIAAGKDYPVFDLPWGRAGIMVCYDVCFPEVARILALRGAEVVLFPALQRSYTERELELQVKARAYDNFLWIVRSSYGTPRGEPWQPGVPVGKSCIAAPDGTLAADLGRFVGVALAQADLDRPQVGPVSHGGPLAPLREARLADRRPETYGAISEPLQ